MRSVATAENIINERKKENEYLSSARVVVKSVEAFQGALCKPAYARSHVEWFHLQSHIGN